MMFRYLRPVPAAAAQGLVATVYRQMGEDFVLAPPLTLHSHSPDMLAAVWICLRETVLLGQVRRAIKEAVAARISLANECPYCVDIHSLLLSANSSMAAARAVRRGQGTGGVDPELDAAITWAAECLTPGGAALASPPFPREHAPEMVGTVMAFQYINRLVTILLADSPFGATPRFLRGVLATVGGRLASSRMAPPRGPAGASLDLLPSAQLPADHSWALGNGAVAGAFARFWAATEAAAERSVPERARQRVASHLLERWMGEPAGLGLDWLDAELAGLAGADYAAARLALLVARAPYRVTSGDVQTFRTTQPSDGALIDVLAWAAFTASRRTASWVRGPY